MAPQPHPNYFGQQAHTQATQLHYQQYQAQAHAAAQQQYQQQQVQQHRMAQQAWQQGRVHSLQGGGPLVGTGPLQPLPQQELHPQSYFRQPPLQFPPAHPQQLRSPSQPPISIPPEYPHQQLSRSQAQPPLRLPPDPLRQLKQHQHQQLPYHQEQPPLQLPPEPSTQSGHPSQPPLQLPPAGHSAQPPLQLPPAGPQHPVQPPLQLPFPVLGLLPHDAKLQALLRDQHILDTEVWASTLGMVFQAWCRLYHVLLHMPYILGQKVN